MKRLLWLAPLGLLALTLPGTGSPLPPMEPFKGEIRPFGRETRVENFEGNRQRACAIVTGRGSPLGLYVFDRHGNCVANNDLAFGPGRDKAAASWFPTAVEWFPIEVGPFTLEILNFGRSINRFSAVLY